MIIILLMGVRVYLNLMQETVCYKPSFRFSALLELLSIESLVQYFQTNRNIHSSTIMNSKECRLEKKRKRELHWGTVREEDKCSRKQCCVVGLYVVCSFHFHLLVSSNKQWYFRDELYISVQFHDISFRHSSIRTVHMRITHAIFRTIIHCKW